jgi:hypothetical protein
MKETIVLTASDGHDLPAYRSTPDGALRGELVVLQEFFGFSRSNPLTHLNLFQHL